MLISQPQKSLEQLKDIAQHLVENSVRSSTQKTYSSVQKRFVRFCHIYGRTPFPCDQDMVVLFVTYLHSNGLKLSSIRVYLSAICLLHICEGHSNPLAGCLRLDLLLRAVAIQNGLPAQKLPITYCSFDWR